MARRTQPVDAERREQHEDRLRWRFSWLVRSNLLAPSYAEIGREAARLGRLPIAEAVTQLEELLAERGLLARAERLIASLERSRPRGGAA